MLWIFGSEVWETPPGQTGGVYPFKGTWIYQIGLTCPARFAAYSTAAEPIGHDGPCSAFPGKMPEYCQQNPIASNIPRPSTYIRPATVAN